MTNRNLGAQWGSEWPQTITLGEAAKSMNFELEDGENTGQVLHKTSLPMSSIDHTLKGSGVGTTDTEDRMSPIRSAFKSGPSKLPPVVPQGPDSLRDGHHRIKAAKEFGASHVAAYVPRSQP